MIRRGESDQGRCHSSSAADAIEIFCGQREGKKNGEGEKRERER